MRSILLAAVMAVAISGSAWAQAPAPQTTTTFTVACRDGEKVTAPERTAVETLAMAAFDRIASRRHADLYALLAPELQRQLTPDGLSDLLGQLERTLSTLDPNGKLTNGRVTATYLLDVTGTPPERFASCIGANGRTEAEVAIDVAAKQAHVMVEGDGAGMGWAINLWLREEAGRWDIFGFHFGNTTMARRDAFTMWAAARTARAKDEKLMAALLYRSALALARRGDFFTLPLKREIEADLRSYDATLVDPERITTYWEDGAAAYGSSSVVVAQSPDGAFRIVLDRDEWVWRGTAAVEADNRAVIRSFLRIFPEVPREFQAVEVRAVHPDGKVVHVTEYRIDKRRFVTTR